LTKKDSTQILEDVRTLWLIHWQLSPHVDELICMELLIKSLAASWRLVELRCYALRDKRLISLIASSRMTTHYNNKFRHLPSYLRTYYTLALPRETSAKTQSYCPLVELELIVKVWASASLDKTGKREAVRCREPKPEIAT